MLIQTGSKIPDGQLCLTFDDGPGPHSADVSAFLRDEGISATFFLIGKFIPGNGGIVQQLIADGHEVGNHTYSHPWLGADAVHSEITSAHEQLRPFVKQRSERPFFFRPPFGMWPTAPGINDLTTKLGERIGDLYAGPISWDYSGDDWHHWENANIVGAEQALADATARYAQARRGIILMHDHSQQQAVAIHNQTYLMIKRLVPLWKGKGYSFISLRDAFRAGYLDLRM